MRPRLSQVAYELLLANNNEDLEDSDSLAEFVDQCKVGRRHAEGARRLRSVRAGGNLATGREGSSSKSTSSSLLVAAVVVMVVVAAVIFSGHVSSSWQSNREYPSHPVYRPQRSSVQRSADFFHFSAADDIASTPRHRTTTQRLKTTS